MKNIGIITIHKIFNYGSIFQTYALQEVCKNMGNKVEIIDYSFPNEWHRNRSAGDYIKEKSNILFTHRRSYWKEILLKLFFSYPILKQHHLINSFVKKYFFLSKRKYYNYESLKELNDKFDVCIVGSDQVWNPRFCKCDPAFFLTFISDECKKVSYASSFGVRCIEDETIRRNYALWLKRFTYLSVREKTGVDIIKKLTGQTAEHVLDPTLLLDAKQWCKIATLNRLVKGKYILCYFLNYTFDAFPRANEIADHISKMMKCKIVYVARPPHRFYSPSTVFRVGASPADFLALIRDAEIVLTTSFHGTAFSINFNKPFYSIVENRQTMDSRLLSMLEDFELSHRALSLNDKFPSKHNFFDCDYNTTNKILNEKREISLNYLKQFC